MPTLDDEAIAKKLHGDAKAQAVGVAKIRGQGMNQKPLTPDEELLLWATEANGWTPEKELALLAEGKSRAAVGLLKYPHRQKLMAAGERSLSKLAQAKYAAAMARNADPTWTPRPPEGAAPPPLPEAAPEAPPPPDPLAFGG